MNTIEQQQRQQRQQQQPAAPPVAQQQAHGDAQAATSWPPPLPTHALLRHQLHQSGSQLQQLTDPPAAATFQPLNPAADGAAARPTQAAISEPLPPVPPPQQQHSRRRHSYSTSAGPSSPPITAAAADDAPNKGTSIGPILAAALAAARRPASAPPSPVLQAPEAPQADSQAAGRHEVPRGGSPPVLPKPKKVRLQVAGSSGRMLWTAELHDLFLSAVAQRGGAESATPNEILQIMNVEGLSRENVKSHLQKHRQQVRELRLLQNMEQMQAAKTSRGVSQSLHHHQQQQQQQPMLTGNLSLLAASQAGHEQQATFSAAAASLGAAVQGLGWQHGQQAPSSSSSESSIDKQGKLQQQQQHIRQQQQISRPSSTAVHPQQQLLMQHKQDVATNKVQAAAAAGGAAGGAAAAGAADAAAGVAADGRELDEAAADELSGLQVLSTVAEEAGQLLDDDDDVCMRDSSPMQRQEPVHHQEAGMSAAAQLDAAKQHATAGVSAAPLQACQCAVCQRRVSEHCLAAEWAVSPPDPGAAARVCQPLVGGTSSSAMQVLSAALLVLDPTTRARLAAVLQLLTVQGVISWHDPPLEGPGEAPRECAQLLQAAMTQRQKR